VRQLTGLDAQFLALETPRQVGHVSGFAIYDPSTAPGGELTLEAVQNLIAERLPLLPPFTWRLTEVPLKLDYGYWVEDPDFDLDFHVRELAIPAPPTKEKIAEQISRITSRPLDRSRPLWELYLIHGLPEGRVGMVTKIHHAVIDGVSGAEIMAVLLDLGPEGREPPPPGNGRAPRPPSDTELLLRGLLGLTRYPVRVARALPSTVPNIEDVPILNDLPGAKTLGRATREIARALRGGERRVLERSTLKAPFTTFNGRMSGHRRFAYGRFPLEDVKAIKNAHSCTINDVVVTVCAGAVRRWLIEHHELPDDPLVAQIPVSVRTQEQIGTYGNRIGMMSAPLFTDEPDPVSRLLRTHVALKDLKARHKALPAEMLQDATQFIPPAVFARAARISFSLAGSNRVRPPWNLVISNVPGPQFPLYCAGARLEANYPVSVITDGLGLNITVMSYCGNVDVGIVADREQMPDLWNLIDWVGDEIEALKP
jgi:WS/DGAT/MGAT family acyltransferase